ncbi:MAG TPA: tRNA pseudouridine(38-40) synthase TruA [Chloroflexota bacterium]|nr:tRNA pseudouridine(38-40) synthase TruA [Chloroflexota bacterium]
MAGIVEYLGTEYAGFQRQRNKMTVQGVIEEAIESVTGERVTLTASGRTDAGAHAEHQVISFVTSSALPTDVMRRALNAHLPTDVKVVRLTIAPPEFHPRFHAAQRTYRYVIWNRDTASPLWQGRAAHIRLPLDDRRMADAANALVGEHDFSAFVKSAAPGGRRRRLDTLRVTRDGDLVTIEMTGSGFLRQMARSIAGTLIGVGLGRLAAADVGSILLSRDRLRAGETAPACGLYLTDVQYPVSRDPFKE